MGRAGTAAHVEKIVRGWRYVDRQVEAQDAKARHRGRSLQVYTDEDGMVVVRGRLSAEAGAVLVRALEAARATLYTPGQAANAAQGPVADPPTFGQQQADALALVAETALEQGLGGDPGSERYQVVVHVDAAVLADPAQPGQSVLEDGVRVPAETSRRLACEATRVELRHAADGSVLDVGRRTRTIPPTLRRALEARDRGCRFPGCRVRRAQGHHIHHWANGGPTRLDNLALLCGRHHRAVHEEGYTVVRDPDGTLRFTTPGGWPIPEVPAPPAVPRDPAPALVATNGRTAWRSARGRRSPDWCGERLDLGWAIDVLHPARQPGRVSRPGTEMDEPGRSQVGPLGAGRLPRRSRLAGGLPAAPRRIAAQTRSGRSGIARSRMPSGASASTTALTIAAGAPTEPASPAPLAPSGLTGVGVTVRSSSKDGRSSAFGAA